MSKDEIINELKEQLESITAYSNKSLINRSEWGDIGFEIAKPDIDSVLSIADDLSRLGGVKK